MYSLKKGKTTFLKEENRSYMLQMCNKAKLKTF